VLSRIPWTQPEQNVNINASNVHFTWCTKSKTQKKRVMDSVVCDLTILFQLHSFMTLNKIKM
jgi:hypothetical protein